MAYQVICSPLFGFRPVWLPQESAVLEPKFKLGVGFKCRFRFGLESEFGSNVLHAHLCPANNVAEINCEQTDHLGVPVANFVGGRIWGCIGTQLSRSAFEPFSRLKQSYYFAIYPHPEAVRSSRGVILWAILLRGVQNKPTFDKLVSP